MAIWDDADEPLPGLKPGHFRGVRFHIPDISHDVGRRAVATWFPGVDAAAFDDFGRLDGPIRLDALIIGDDHVERALALQAALQQAGAGTLLHPWLGEKTVIVSEPASIHFSVQELRVVRVQAAFLPVSTAVPTFQSSTARLLSASAAALSTVQTFLVASRGGTLAAATVASAGTTLTDIADMILAKVAASVGAADLTLAVEAKSEALADALTATGEGEEVKAFAAAAVDLIAPITTLAVGTAAPAVATRIAAEDTTLTSRAGTVLLVEIAAAVREADAVGAPAEAARLALEVAALASAVEACVEISYESRQDAMASRDLIDDALALAETDASDIAPDMPGAVAPVLAALGLMRARLAADLNEVIGRLPTVRVFTLPAPASVWLLAQHFAGDDPANVVAMLDDIVTRNKLHHPSAAPMDGVEVLS